jgi:GNAT superfamily N-acetyltransferase
MLAATPGGCVKKDDGTKDGRKIEFRKSLPKDFDFVFQVEAEIKRPAAQAAGHWEEASARAKARQAFRPGEDLIVRVDGADVGLLALGSYKELLWLRRLELLPKFQRKGIGTAVIKTVLQGARAKGAGVFLRIRKEHAAQNLFMRLGFHVSGENSSEDEMIAPPA